MLGPARGIQPTDYHRIAGKSGGIADLGRLPSGSYSLGIELANGLQTNASVLLGPGRDAKQTIVCPGPLPQLPIRFEVREDERLAKLPPYFVAYVFGSSKSRAQRHSLVPQRDAPNSRRCWTALEKSWGKCPFRSGNLVALAKNAAASPNASSPKTFPHRRRDRARTIFSQRCPLRSRRRRRRPLGIPPLRAAVNYFGQRGLTVREGQANTFVIDSTLLKWDQIPKAIEQSYGNDRSS